MVGCSASVVDVHPGVIPIPGQPLPPGVEKDVYQVIEGQWTNAPLKTDTVFLDENSSETLESKLTEIDESQASQDQAIADLTSNVTTLEGRVTEIDEDQDSQDQAIADLVAKVTTLEEQVPQKLDAAGLPPNSLLFVDANGDVTNLGIGEDGQTLMVSVNLSGEKQLIWA